MSLLIWLCLLIALPLMIGCSTTSPAPGPIALATVAPLADIVRSIAGTAIRVGAIVPEGVDSHSFEPTPSDARSLREAQVIFLNGLDLEPAVAKLARANLAPTAQIVELGPLSLPRDGWIFDTTYAQGHDPNPHLWMDPILAKRYSEVIRDALASSFPRESSRFTRNQATFAARIDALDDAIKTATATIPVEHRKLLTYHDSLPYLARRYGYTSIGAIQPSNFSAPSAREVARIADQIRKTGVPAIFGSEVFPSRVLERLASQTGVKYVAVIRDDTLPGGQGDLDHTYLGMIRADMSAIVDALGGDSRALAKIDASPIQDQGR